MPHICSVVWLKHVGLFHVVIVIAGLDFVTFIAIVVVMIVVAY